MNFFTSSYFQSHGQRQKDIEKAIIYENIVVQNETTRKRLYQQLRIRPNNITTCVQELIDSGLIYEDNLIKKSKQGRPEILLKANKDKLVAISIWIESTYLVGALIDLEGNQNFTTFQKIPEDADNTAFLDNLYSLTNSLLIKVKAKQCIIGIGFALPGVVASHQSKWIFNSRWPNVKNLDLLKLSNRYNMPISIYRMLDAQLEALITQKTQLLDQSVFLVHWGYGIGASFSINGTVLTSSIGSTCEIGHIKVKHPNNLLCNCKETGCLETIAAGWAILPELEKQYGTFKKDETFVSQKMETTDIEGNPIISEAINSIAEIVDTMYRINYPDKIIFYGPFISNHWVKETLKEQIIQRIPSYAKNSLEIEFIMEDMNNLSPQGSTISFFKNKLEEMLIAK